MPVLRYLMWVGGGLLALLFAADLYLPKQPAQVTTSHTYNIPIAASTPPGQKAVTFSGETQNFGPPPPMTVVDFSAQPNRAAQNAANQTAAESRAEMTATQSSVAQNTKPARKKVARRKTSPQRDFANRDPGYLPDGWRRDSWQRDGWQRDGQMGLAFANPFFR